MCCDVALFHGFMQMASGVRPSSRRSTQPSCLAKYYHGTLLLVTGFVLNGLIFQTTITLSMFIHTCNLIPLNSYRKLSRIATGLLHAKNALLYVKFFLEVNISLALLFCIFQ